MTALIGILDAHERWIRVSSAIVVNSCCFCPIPACSVVIGAIGDLICQFYVEKADSLNWRRLINMCVLQGVLVGPTLHVWYGFLASKVPGASWAAVAKRLALDQVRLRA